MTVLSRRQFTVTDQAGDVVPGAWVEVNPSLVLGYPLAPLFADRDGATPLANPFQADANGFAYFHAAGGVYRIRAYVGPSESPTFEQIWNYVAVGNIDEMDYSTDGTLAANSDELLPTQKAVKTYVDGVLGAVDAMIFKGVIDCSGDPNYPAADCGWTYKVSVAGKIGAGSGTNVEAGDVLICRTDGTLAGTQAAVGAQWAIVQANVDGAVAGPASSVSGNIPTFSGTSGKVLQDSGKALPAGTVVGTSDAQVLTNKTINAASNAVSNLATSMFAANVVDTDGTMAANSDTRLATQKAAKAYADSVAGGGFATGTLMLFQQTAAPLGWTKQTTHNDKALRVVSGTASSGGTNSFSTVMAQTTVGSTTLTTPTMPSHGHGYTAPSPIGAFYDAFGSAQQVYTTTGATTGSAGGGGSHNHSITMAIQYVDIIIAAKD